MVRIMIALIHFYRLFAPLRVAHCRFYPSCSVYAQTALERFGFFRGMALSVVRILKCHPFHPGGVDPVPEYSLRYHYK